jgi:hypothetical protein
VAVQHEVVPRDGAALDALIKKYATPADGGMS